MILEQQVSLKGAMREKTTVSSSNQFPSAGREGTLFKKRVFAFLSRVYVHLPRCQFESSFFHLSLLPGQILICKMDVRVMPSS